MTRGICRRGRTGRVGQMRAVTVKLRRTSRGAVPATLWRRSRCENRLHPRWVNRLRPGGVNCLQPEAISPPFDAIDVPCTKRWRGGHGNDEQGRGQHEKVGSGVGTGGIGAGGLGARQLPTRNARAHPPSARRNPEGHYMDREPHGAVGVRCNMQLDAGPAFALEGIRAKHSSLPSSP